MTSYRLSMSGKDELLRWCRDSARPLADRYVGAPHFGRVAPRRLPADATRPRRGVDVRNFGSTWVDGLALCAMFHTHVPSLLPRSLLDRVIPSTPTTANDENDALRVAFDVSARAGIPRTCDPSPSACHLVIEMPRLTAARIDRSLSLSLSLSLSHDTSIPRLTRLWLLRQSCSSRMTSAPRLASIKSRS